MSNPLGINQYTRNFGVPGTKLKPKLNPSPWGRTRQGNKVLKRVAEMNAAGNTVGRIKYARGIKLSTKKLVPIKGSRGQRGRGQIIGTKYNP